MFKSSCHPCTVRMLGGQVVELPPGKNTYIPASDGNAGYTLKLDYIGVFTPLSEATFGIIVATLKTYSQDYSRVIAYTTRAAFLNSFFQLDREITLKDIQKWSSITPASYWAFLKFYLYQLSRIRSEGFIDDEVRAFLASPEQFEEDAKGAYFPLLTNDPDRGALTEQELKNLQTALNQAYSGAKISFMDYAFTWTSDCNRNATGPVGAHDFRGCHHPRRSRRKGARSYAHGPLSKRHQSPDDREMGPPGSIESWPMCWSDM